MRLLSIVHSSVACENSASPNDFLVEISRHAAKTVQFWIFTKTLRWTTGLGAHHLKTTFSCLGEDARENGKRGLLISCLCHTFLPFTPHSAVRVNEE